MLLRRPLGIKVLILTYSGLQGVGFIMEYIYGPIVSANIFSYNLLKDLYGIDLLDEIQEQIQIQIQINQNEIDKILLKITVPEKNLRQLYLFSVQ